MDHKATKVGPIILNKGWEGSQAGTITTTQTKIQPFFV